MPAAYGERSKGMLGMRGMPRAQQASGQPVQESRELKIQPQQIKNLLGLDWPLLVEVGWR